MNFLISALPKAPFIPLFALSDAELAAQNARSMTVTESPGVPCRVSLEDARVGERVLLLNHMHQPGDSPYKASHAIYVREQAEQAALKVNEVPALIRRRLISVRFFDDAHMMREADVVQGEDVASAIAAAFKKDEIAYAHLHIAKPGCFAAAVSRVD